MAEWLVEKGIGETRALLVDGENVLCAKVFWPGELRAGDKVQAQLISKDSGKRRGVAETDQGRGILIDHLPHAATEGMDVPVRISRAPIAEKGRLKLAQGRVIEGNMSQNETETVSEPWDGKTVRQFAPGLWEEVWHAASSGSIAFPGGEILCSVTPAMTVIDIDGHVPARGLALAAIPAIARALCWFEMGGNIGIDFPSLEAKADRRKVDEAMSSALADWPHERTAMNGFGFMQIIAQLKGPSLLHRFATSRTAMCARYAMRGAERAQGTGSVLALSVHPTIKAKLKSEWLDELTRRIGKEVRVETNPSLALEAPQAQIISI